MRDGTLTRAEGDERSQEKWLTLPGNYPPTMPLSATRLTA